MATTARPPRPPADVEPALAPTLAGQRFAVVDVETTGLKASRHRIVQVAVVTTLGDGTVLDRWSTLVNPPFGWVSASARRIHG